MPTAPQSRLGDARRLAALDATLLMDSAPEDAFDRVTRLAARVLGVPVALLSLVDERRQYFKSFVGVPEPWASRRETPLSHSFCQHVVARQEPLVVEDARLHPLVRENLAIRDLGVIAYAGVPVRDADGHVLGSFCAIHGEPHAWSPEELRLLAEFGEIATTEVHLRHALREARRGHEALHRQALAFANVQDAVIVTEIDGTITEWNDGAERNFGWTRDEAVGRNVVMLQPLEVREAAAAAMKETVLTEGRWAGETTFVRADGSRRTFEAVIVCARDETGAPFGVVGVCRDVTERHAADETLRRQALVFENLQDGVLVLAPGGLVIDCNPAAERVLGRTRAELVGGPVSRWHAPGFASPAPAIARGVREEGRWAGEIVFERADGGLVLAETAVVQTGGAGLDLPRVALVRDVTARRHTEERLRDSERRLSLIHDTTSDLLFLMAVEEDDRFRCLSINPAYERRTGLTVRDTVGREIRDILPPDGAAFVLARYRDVVATGQPMTYDEVHDLPAGHLVLETTLTPVLDADGRVTHLLGAARDVSARAAAEEALRASEERYRAMAETIPDHLWTATPDGLLDYANERTFAYMGADAEAVLGDGWGAFVHPEDLPRVRARWAEALASGGTYAEEMRVRRHDGAYRWHVARALPLHDAAGTVVKWFGVNADTHARKEAEAAMIEARDAALRSARMKAEFLANMSHEIRTPLNGVTGLTSLLRVTALSDEQREYVEGIAASSDALLSLLSDILDFSKIEAAMLSLEARPFSLARVADSATLPFRAQAAAKGLALTFDAPEGLPDLVGDAGRVRQILTNLVGNAVKFTARGGVRVSVATAVGRDAAVVTVRVADTGVGIPADKLEHVFEKFTQADSSTTRRYGGTGLGLAIVRQLCRLMGGDVSLESVEGVGSTFTVSLRLPVAAPAAPVATGGGAAEVLARRGRVLVVEDDVTSQLVARRMLRQLGAEVEVAGDGRAAVAAAAAGGFDLVLMDCHLPELDGWAATAALREHEARAGLSRTPIVAMTAGALAGDRERCLDAGMDDYVSKPVELRTLRTILERWLPDA